MRKILSGFISILALWTSSAHAQAQFEGAAASKGFQAPVMLCLRNDSDSTAWTTGDLQWSPCAVDSAGRMKLGAITPGTGTTNLGIAEDANVPDGKVGVMLYGVRQDAWATTSGTAGDATMISLTQSGAIRPDISIDWQDNTAKSLLKAEDAVVASADSGVGALFKAQDPLTIDEASGDYSLSKVDLAGRSIVAPYAPPGETWQACSGQATGTSSTQIKAAVASNRIYTTSICCQNASAVDSPLLVLDGATAISLGGVAKLATNGGIWCTQYPTPLRGTSNTALNFQMSITATATTCCAAGYVSVN